MVLALPVDIWSEVVNACSSCELQLLSSCWLDLIWGSQKWEPRRKFMVQALLKPQGRGRTAFFFLAQHRRRELALCLTRSHFSLALEHDDFELLTELIAVKGRRWIEGDSLLAEYFIELAERGKLQLLKRLHTYFPVHRLAARHIAEEALYLASCGGHISVVQWLFTQVPQLASKAPRVLADAAVHGHRKLIRWTVETFQLTVLDLGCMQGRAWKQADSRVKPLLKELFHLDSELSDVSLANICRPFPVPPPLAAVKTTA